MAFVKRIYIYLVTYICLHIYIFVYKGSAISGTPCHIQYVEKLLFFAPAINLYFEEQTKSGLEYDKALAEFKTSVEQLKGKKIC